MGGRRQDRRGDGRGGLVEPNDAAEHDGGLTVVAGGDHLGGVEHACVLCSDVTSSGCVRWGWVGAGDEREPARPGRVAGGQARSSSKGVDQCRVCGWA